LINPEFLSHEEIRQKAEEFRNQFIDSQVTIPVQIEEVFEIKLGIQPRLVAKLLNLTGIDGFLTKDCKQIYIDERIFNESFTDRRAHGRLRFTYAHEIGHLTLHKDIIDNAKFNSEEEWRSFRMGISEFDISRVEYQANEFAGRLLVPKTCLIEEVEKNKDKIRLFKEKFPQYDEDELIDTISRIICERFDLNSSVVSIRIKREEIFEELGL